MMNTHHLLAKIEALSTKMPVDPDEIDEMLELVIKVLNHRFEAYLIDIMWETGQGQHTALRAVKMLETEEHGYSSRPIYLNGDKQPDSLTGWCYENNRPIWIVDREGFSAEREYVNLWGDSERDVIPAGTIYEYNTKPMKTEICVPLAVKVADTWERAAGVLNIEIDCPLMPSKAGKAIAGGAAAVIEQLQSRKIACQAAKSWATRELRKIRKLGTLQEESVEPSLMPTVFVAWPMKHSGIETQKEWLEEYFTSNGITVRFATHGRQNITEEIWRSIDAAHLGVVLSTGFNRNVLLEWGYLLGRGKPVIRLHQVQGDNESDPFDVSTIRRHVYAQPSEVPDRETFFDVLESALIDILEHHEDVKNVFPQILPRATAK